MTNSHSVYKLAGALASLKFVLATAVALLALFTTFGVGFAADNISVNGKPCLKTNIKPGQTVQDLDWSGFEANGNEECLKLIASRFPTSDDFDFWIKSQGFSGGAVQSETSSIKGCYQYSARTTLKKRFFSFTVSSYVLTHCPKRADGFSKFSLSVNIL